VLKEEENEVKSIFAGYFVQRLLAQLMYGLTKTLSYLKLSEEQSFCVNQKRQVPGGNWMRCVWVLFDTCVSKVEIVQSQETDGLVRPTSLSVFQP